ncbi:hypothetical protein U1P98_04510 [Lysinibacillus irui]|uniref:Uncharacterized protein n=1 Tax=Lysinibacillus irui TaxID=2998077 RepID=A0ABU5NHP6_9BACI|nr:hypothetical protein [Lysinibacillus irui]MEA0552972.1 hypothetical protein [Lysinibacillus irui]MEA0975552.1 hypothetical protein [Lysinibacillus irui]MEA1041706.1 hypothetical protein [Lysinibacillus irui]
MAKYFYDKYTTVATQVKADNAPWFNHGSSGYNGEYRQDFSMLYLSYSFNPATNTYIAGPKWDPNSPVEVGSVGYAITYDSSQGSAAHQWNRLMKYTALEARSAAVGTLIWVEIQERKASENTSVTEYSRGSLVQSGILAEDGTYPVNGQHTDGYWYVRGAINTAPTMPGAFTQPSGNLEIGDSKVFAVGAAYDAEGNLSKYIWEASINGGAFSKVGETTVNSLAYTIPTATSLKMRVKAVDSAGLESAYRESSLYTVQPPQYYYDKFTVIKNDTPVYEYVQEWSGESFEGQTTQIDGNTSYTFDKNTGKFTLTGSRITLYPYSGQTVYALFGSTLRRYTAGTEPYLKWASCTVVYKQVSTNTTYTKGTLIQTGITGGATAYPTNGRHTDGYWYVRGSRVSQSIAPPSAFTSPAVGKKFKPNEAATIAFGASNAANLSLYEVDYRYNTTGAWTPLPYNNTLTRSLTITTDKTLKTLELRVRAKDTSNVYSDYVYSEVFEIEHNVAPTVSLTGPGDNTTLYENDSYNIAGTAYDDDKDQSVTVYYQINNEPRKVLATNLSKTQIALSKQLTFKAGKLYDGETVITNTLSEGVAHKLKVWAVDNENAPSVEIERSFYVVPNRAPLLSIDAVVPSGIINTDIFTISGTASDQDANSNVKVNFRINGANPIEIYDGTGGAWEFDVTLSQLQVGENTIIIEVIDNYGAKTSKTVKLKKNEVKTPILQSVARYKVEPPKGSAKGVLIWVQRDEGLDLKAELSMTLKGEQESYEQLTAMHTAPVYEGVLEDEFYYETSEPKDNIILKLTTSRADVTIDNKIYLIMGVLE